MSVLKKQRQATSALLAFLAVLWQLAPIPAAGQTLAAIEAAEATFAAAWAETPITARKLTFVATSPTGCGSVEPRADARFAPGEPIILYAEPVGYGYTPLADGRWRFGFDVDLLIKTASGAIMDGQEGLERLSLESRCAEPGVHGHADARSRGGAAGRLRSRLHLARHRQR